MGKKYTRREALNVALKGTLVGAVGVLGAEIPRVTLAAGFTGTALVFRRRNGAPLGTWIHFGHVGYGLRFNNTLWMFGSIENPGGYTDIVPGRPNGGWYAFGDFFTMLRYMARDQRSHPAYDDTKSIVFSSANPNAARDYGLYLPRSGYALGTWTCEDAVSSVLHAYGVSNLPSTRDEQRPNNWFDDKLTRQLGWHYFSLSQYR